MERIDQILQVRTAPIIKALSKTTAVKGIVCFGSYALGTFDKLSDIDLYVFCHPEITPASERQDALQKIEGITDLYINHIEFDWNNKWNPSGDRIYIKDYLIDVIYNTVDWINTIIQKVISEGATSIPELQFRPYTMLGLLDSSIVLYDPERIISNLKAMIIPYPERLKRNIIATHMQIIKDFIIELLDYTKRGIGNTAFHFELRRIIDSITQVIFAINDCYDPATKRIEQVIRELEIIPVNFLNRYEVILTTPLTNEGRKIVVRELQILEKELESFAK